MPLTFKLGISMNVFDLSSLDPSENALLVTFDAEHPRDFAETVRMGVEYRFENLISLRVGYVSPQDETKWTYGVGFHKTNILGTLGSGSTMLHAVRVVRQRPPALRRVCIIGATFRDK